jgi:hypothetical protein
MAYKDDRHQMLILDSLALHTIGKGIRLADKKEILSQLSDEVFLNSGFGFDGLSRNVGNPAGLHAFILECQIGAPRVRAPLFILLEKHGLSESLGITIADEHAYLLRRYDNDELRRADLRHFFKQEFRIPPSYISKTQAKKSARLSFRATGMVRALTEALLFFINGTLKS